MQPAHQNGPAPLDSSLDPIRPEVALIEASIRLGNLFDSMYCMYPPLLCTALVKGGLKTLGMTGQGHGDPGLVVDSAFAVDGCARLQGKLSDMECVEESVQTVHDPNKSYSMWNMYCRYWQPFGELLTDMEREGMQINRCSSPPSLPAPCRSCFYFR